MRKEQSLTNNKDTVFHELVLGNLDKNIINQINQFSILFPGIKLLTPIFSVQNKFVCRQKTRIKLKV